MKSLLSLFVLGLALLSSVPADAQTIIGARGSDDFKIGVAGYSYRKFTLDRTLQYLQSMDVKYFSVKDWWLPLDSTKEQMDAFKAECSKYGVEGYTLGPVYMRSKEAVDATFAYAQRYGADMFIGVPDYDLLPYVIEKVKETGIRVAVRRAFDRTGGDLLVKIHRLVAGRLQGHGLREDQRRSEMHRTLRRLDLGVDVHRPRTGGRNSRPSPGTRSSHRRGRRPAS